MAEVHKPSIGIAQGSASTSRPRRKPGARVAGRSVIHESLLSVVRLSSAVLTWPAVAIGRLLLGSRSTRIGGHRRTGYPEMDHWSAGRRRGFDK